jgi:hypothetical protein
MPGLDAATLASMSTPTHPAACIDTIDAGQFIGCGRLEPLADGCASDAA